MQYHYSSPIGWLNDPNGLYTYERKPKFDPKEIHPLFSRKAAAEN